MENCDYTSQPSEPPRRRRHRVRTILLWCAGAFAVLVIIVAVAGALTARPAAQVPAAVATSGPAAQPARPAASTAAKPAPVPAKPVTVGKFSGTGNWNSAPFTLNGKPVTVTYTYSGNADPGMDTGSNFIADLSSSGDSQNIVNAIAVSGSTTTTLYPDITGGTSYHLSVQAAGTWSFTLTEAP